MRMIYKVPKKIIIWGMKKKYKLKRSMRKDWEGINRYRNKDNSKRFILETSSWRHKRLICWSLYVRNIFNQNILRQTEASMKRKQ